MDWQRAALLACAQCSGKVHACRGVCAHAGPSGTAEGVQEDRLAGGAVRFRGGLGCFNVCLSHVIVLIKLKFTLQTQSASSTLQKHKSSSSFTPFIDPRLLQISPSSGTTVTSVGK